MAHGSQEFALVGYSEDLERRPLKFVEPIPAARICSACGNIPRRTYTLLCGHIFCEPCYESCATTSECVCPLDSDVCGTNDVSSKEYPSENLLRREVHCWNEAHGCGAILPASQITQHVRRDCQHHVSRCPKCLATVLSRDVCAHLKSRCTALVLHAPHEGQPSADDMEKTHLMAFEKMIEQRVREVDTKLAQLSLESASQSDKLIELCHNNNHLKEALTEQYREASDRNAAEMKAIYCEKSESLMAAITSALAFVPSDPKTHQRTITGYEALKEKAVKDGWSWSMSDEVYLRRYLMSWGICFCKEGDTVYLSLCIKLYKGREDAFLDWPFTKEMKLSIIHPETRQERHFGKKPGSSEYCKKFYSRPIEGSNGPVRFDETKVESSDIERDGYVKSDQLLLRFEVL